MQDNPLQPYFKLAQSNIALMTQFTLSPELVTQAMGNVQSLFQGGQARPIAPSTAWVDLAQGLVKNYTEFLLEVGQGGLAMLAQGQAALLRQAQEASSHVVDATTARRPRQAA